MTELLLSLSKDTNEELEKAGPTSISILDNIGKTETFMNRLRALQ